MSCPLLAESQSFVARAQAEAQKSPVVVGEVYAGRLLQQAREHIYFWPVDFGGFRCQLTVTGEGGPWTATLVAPSSRAFRLQEVHGCPELTRWAHYQVGEILGHREHPRNSRMASKSGVNLGDDHPIYGQRLDFAGDKMASYYRVRDHKITQISRTYAGQSFVICIDRHLELDGYFVASNYSAFYSDPDGSLVKVETYQDDYVPTAQPNGVWLPALRRFTVVQGKQREHRDLRFDQHELLAAL